MAKAIRFTIDGGDVVVEEANFNEPLKEMHRLSFGVVAHAAKVLREHLVALTPVDLASLLMTPVVTKATAETVEEYCFRSRDPTQGIERVIASFTPDATDRGYWIADDLNSGSVYVFVPWGTPLLRPEPRVEGVGAATRAAARAANRLAGLGQEDNAMAMAMAQVQALVVNHNLRVANGEDLQASTLSLCNGLERVLKREKISG